MSEIKKWKDEEEMTMDELTECVSARRNGKSPPRFKTSEYLQAEREALEDAGLEPDDEGGEDTAVEDMSTDEHYERLRGADRAGR
jgi:hypothetical protein